MKRWWSIKDNRLSHADFCLFSILQLYKQKHIKCIWHLVVAATLWTIWLTRNDLIFNKVRVSESVMNELIFIRVLKWGSASKMILYSHIPLWRVNPTGAINLQHHIDISNYWKVQFEHFHVVCVVDAAWKVNYLGSYRRGIGGVIKTNTGSLRYCFSGPSSSKNIHEAEIEAILHAIKVIRTSELRSNRVVICSDSTTTINAIYEGLDQTFPLLQPEFNLKALLHACISLHFVPFVLNEEADSLAKNGINKPGLYSFRA